jgi:transcription antitermination factor NusG
MGIAKFHNTAIEARMRLAVETVDPRWYAAYTSANHEKRVAEQLEVRSVEHFVPLYESMRRWKDRKVRLQLPLFPGYVFVRLALRDRLEVLKVPGVVRLVSFNGLPTPLGDKEVESLQRALAQGVRAEPHPFLTVGRRVRITAGPLAGHEGILVRRKGSLRVVLSMDLVQRSIVVDVDVADIEPILQKRPSENGRERALLL